MPLAAVLIVLLSIALMFLYGVPAVRTRLTDYAETRTFTQAAAAAEALEGVREADLQKELDLSAKTAGGEIMVVDTRGRVVARADAGGDFEPSREILQTAAAGDRVSDMFEVHNVAVTPILEEGSLRGGIVLASDETQSTAYRLFLRSGLEAAAIASILGGGLMLLLGTLLSRRVERLALSARSIEGGDLSSRIKPGFKDELGDLAKTFNAMAAKLQDSFAHLESRVAERTAELEGERARLEAVLRQMPSGVIIAEAPSGRLVLGNEKVEQIWRHPFRPATSIEDYSHQYQILHLDGRPYQVEERPLARSIRTGEVVKAEEFVFVRGDGTCGTMQFSSTPIRDREGCIVAGVAIFDDITEQKRAEEELRASEERYRVFAETAQDAIVMIDEDSRILFVNDAAESIFGYAKADMLEQRLTMLMPERLREAHLTAFERYLDTDRRHLDWRSVQLPGLHKSGKELPLEISFGEFIKGEKRFFTGFIRDITERRRAEEAIRTRARQQAAVAQLGRIALASADVDGLMQRAVSLVANTLEVEYCKVLELLPGGDVLLLRAGVGWREGLVGKDTVDAGTDSQAGFALLSGEPVIVEDLRSEQRFGGPPLLRDHGVTSGMSTTIQGQERPYGVLGAHTRERRVFTQDDVNFLQAVANVLAAAIERKRAEEALQESEERFRATFEQAAVGVAHNAPDGRWLKVNDKLCQIVGYSQEEMLEGSFQDITHPEDLDTDLEYSRRLLAGEIETYSVEKRYIRKDGSVTWTNLTASLVRGPSGEPKYRIAVIEDINERKRIESALRESEERFRLITENARDLICMMDTEGRYVYVSPSYKTVLGYATEALLGMRFTDLVHPKDLACLQDWQNAAQFEFRARQADGSWVWMEGSSYKIRWQGEPYVVGISRDITERKRIEQKIRRLNEDLEERVKERTAQLEQERATLDAILNNLSEGVLAADSGQRVVFANPAARSMLGLSSEEPLEELPDPWEDFDLPGVTARCVEGQGECIEVRVQDRDTLLQVKLEHLPELGDHRGGALMVIQDLSEGRRLETRQQRFLANAAHELKTPITTILGASDLLLTEEEDDPELRRRFLNHIFTEARRMQRLSETLLHLARVGWDLREPESEALDLEAAAREVIWRMVPLAESAGIELSLTGQGARVRADQEWLEQALMVVVSNAVKYSSRGGRIRLHLDGGVVEVEDEGAGISAEDLPHVFDRFYQGQDNSGGFGLGLPICKELIERMGGKISIESEAGVGTTVRIELPEVQDD